MMFVNEQIQSFKNEIGELRKNQLTEIDLRCQEVDSLKEQLSGQLETIKEENSSLAGQVTELTSENKKLQEKLSCLDLEWRCKFEQVSNKCSRLLHEKECLEVQVVNLSEMVEQLKTGKAALKSQHGQVQRFVLPDLNLVTCDIFLFFTGNWRNL